MSLSTADNPNSGRSTARSACQNRQVRSTMYARASVGRHRLRRREQLVHARAFGQVGEYGVEQAGLRVDLVVDGDPRDAGRRGDGVERETSPVAGGEQVAAGVDDRSAGGCGRSGSTTVRTHRYAAFRLTQRIANDYTWRTAK